MRILPVLLLFIGPALSNACSPDTVAADSLKKSAAIWKKKLTGTITMSQTSFTNWAKGGQNSITWNMRLTGDAAKSTSGRWGYKFSSVMVWGQTKQENEPVRNTMDKIDLDASFSFRINKYINPEIGLGILTQFSKGYDYKKNPPVPKSKFFDPAFVTQSLGGTVKIHSFFSSRLGIGLKQTITDEFTQYSNNPKTAKVEKIKFESGIDSHTQVLNAKILGTLIIRSKLHLFSSFEHLDVIDMDWDTLLTAKVNSHVIITLNLLLKYDRDNIDKLQVKETTALGLSYNFI